MPSDTEKAALRERLEQLQNQIDAEKEFVNVAAHQLQEPLASMKWLLENLLSGLSGTFVPAQREVLMRVYQTNEQTIQLMKDLLTVARLEGGRLKITKKPTDLIDLVRTVMKRHEADIADHHGEMYFTGPRGGPQKFNLDATLLSQAIDNLLSNAIKYNPVRTHITVTVTLESDHVIIAVKNRGPAIPQEKQARLFQKFVRAGTPGTEKTKGTGLGLYITKQIVERHGGEVTFHSAQEEGTTFFISLPTNTQ